MTAPTVTNPPDFPQRSVATDENAYVAAVEAWGGAMPTFGDEVQAVGEFVEATAGQVALDRAASAVSEAGAAEAQKNAETAQGLAEDARDLAQVFAASALNAPGTSATSTTSRSLTTGSKAFTLVQTGKLFSVGQTVVVTRTSDPTKRMVGPITSFAADVLTVDVQLLSSTGGPYTDWTIALSAPALNGLASQAEAEAGTVNDKDMSPLRVAQAIQALGKTYTVIGSITPANGDTAAAFTSIPTVYEDLIVEIEGITVSGISPALNLAFGDISAAYTGPSQIAAGAAVMHGAVLIPAAKRDRGGAFPCVVATTGGLSGGALSSAATSVVAWSVAGGIRALRISGSGSFQAGGTIRLLGR
jgi:hypothetical protein